jgi:4-hydroxy-2-oxoheptanedioate aldolase
LGGERLNRVIDKLASGEVVVSSLPVANASYEEAQRYGDSDFDMVIFEMEHQGFDFIGLRNSLQAVLSRGRILEDGLAPSVVPFTRIPPPARETTQWVIKQALDLGVYGFVAPQLETAEEARAIVNASRYPAQRGSALGGGQRGYSPQLAARYWGLGVQEYTARADLWPLNPDGELLVVGIVESRNGVENLERILDAGNGIGAIWPGAGDLSADMGLMNQVGHPEVEEQVQRVLAVCRDRGVPCVGVAAGAADAVQRVEQGFRIIFTGMERGVASAVRAVGGARHRLVTE